MEDISKDLYVAQRKTLHQLFFSNAVQLFHVQLVPQDEYFKIF